MRGRRFYFLRYATALQFPMKGGVFVVVAVLEMLQLKTNEEHVEGDVCMMPLICSVVLGTA